VKLVSEVTPVGDILSTGSGRTVYAFSLDSAHHSACRNPCASVWPALTYTKLTLGAGVAQSKVGVVIRPDGDKQVTYGGHPLYVYTGDTSAQEINGDGITSYGGTWHAVLVSGATVSSSAAPGSGGFY
jgi:predicted lipoprotein with Yx(FWY)xxD motif